ncbi:transcription-repair coupling factor [Fructilactobacillus fructivorans]|uniref:Transcription-repair-coupling factor n=1 Tax=Fructilactobacillus fructivorans TaxID=1614 RepID=A0A0C1PM61_9LACO|nr:transcription-repair coupling factor [Fructilactobacillus fructivorans]KID41031.1 Transcription-repair coupling factor [Fructilactobacillus fructivorans]MCT0151403.1 transcription-repair coupling factor [Fructilactobacillus fructivorans]MCT2866922.1 transcription-repair coupling factor [Fructilactobacillus fructivorans]MCT2869223.1 transcription-repair coupling factor [Fructilactobacillus fructivorans]MCT2873740.1 transcription-repair coupling factor [Fructilactobacillus fructivorans]
MKLDETLREMPQYEKISSKLDPDTKQLITGTSGSARTLLLKQLINDKQKPTIYVTDTMNHADQMTESFNDVMDSDQVFEFPAEELVAAEIATSSPQYRAQRVRALNALESGKPVVVIVSTAGLKRYLPEPVSFNQAQLHAQVGDDLDLEKIQQELVQMGYERKNMVAAPGEFANRGSILDIYPLNSDYPVRIDFFDTEVDSMRYFDAATQRSVKNINEINVLPASDFLPSEADRKHGIKELQKRLDQAIKDDGSDILVDKIQQVIDGLKGKSIDQKWSEYSQFIFEKETSILDYLPENGMVVYDDYSRVRDANKQLENDEKNWRESIADNHELFSDQKLSLDFRTITRNDHHATLLFSLFQKGLGRMKLSDIIDIKVHPMQRFFGQMPMFKAEMQRYQTEKRTVVIAVGDEKRVEKVSSTLNDFGVDAIESTTDNIIKGKTQIVSANLKDGFDLPAANLAVVSESDMFKRVNEQKKKKRVRRQTFSNAERIKSYTDLKPGDYVVHVNHGIGRYDGMKTMEVDGRHQDYMTLTYQKGAKIYVPVDQLNLVQKYVSSEDKHPKINKLGGTEWAKTKRSVASKVEDIADDLVDLYAKREAESGYAFPVDDQYQTEFEQAFPYTETPDQIRSTDEIKKDMESPHPMDRLLVGDVGYGKTEVALRAAFKAVEAGKQVAFLVPTTVLAQQHYETMMERFDGFPVKVGVLSRFDTPKQTRQTIQDLKDGKIDIVVGTHRLLSKDVKFNDLGLLIVDEEQRFGVKHKEKIKELRSNVDVLTLTATPIPRTLNMSMMGVRDLSVIETPPANRYPIQTYVMEQNEGSIVDGIRREMQRGGQVFYLHNRVKDIDQTVDKLQTLLPDARIASINGQMSENEMEGILYDFVNGDYDVLVTTTIIETGVDIPNANTLFVEDADRMGLSQLYQIRGRIGRSNRVGQAYFMYQPNKVLTEVSENRLEAIKDFTELGSGFKVAMRDLSIRGAGNVLGKQQHGFINSVGYDMYTKMLSDAVSKKKGQHRVVEKSDSKVELGIEAYLPSTYIEDQQQKIELYKRIRQMDSEDQFTELQSDLIDRFGEYPVEVANLLEIDRIKMLADYDLIEKIRKDQSNLMVTVSKTGTQKFTSKDILKAIADTDFRSAVKVVDGRYQIKLVVQPTMKDKDWLSQLYKFVSGLSKIRLEQEEHESKDK